MRRHETRHFRGVLARDVKGSLKVGKKADCESVQELAESGKSSCGYYTTQARAPGDGFQL